MGTNQASPPLMLKIEPASNDLEMNPKSTKMNLQSFTIAVLTLLMACSDNAPSTASAPRVVQEGSYSIPQEIRIDQDLEAEMCQEKCVIESFLPIGWSTDGVYFSWISQSENPVSGGYHFIITIQNMLENQQIWQWKFEESELPDWDQIMRYDIVRTWNEKRDRFIPQLERFKIHQIAALESFKRWPARINGKAYSARIEKQMQTNADYGFTEIGTEEVFLNIEGQGSQKIYTKVHEEGESWIIHSSLIGIIPSDDRRRGAFVKVNEIAGWHDVPNSLEVEIIGGSL